jgi:CBS domain-containing protein
VPKLLLLWNVAPDKETEFHQALEKTLSGLRSFPGIRGLSFHAAMPPARTFPSFLGTPKYACMLEIDIQSANTIPQLWADTEYRGLIEGLMATVTDFTPLGFRKALFARDIMSTPVITIAPTASFQELVELLARHRISGVPVVDAEGHLVGMATEADILVGKGATVAEVMSRDLITVTEDASTEDIAQILARHRIRRVPVMRGDQVVGIVSREDVVRAMATL